jgi:flagellar hook-length control protein FliK
VDVMPVTGLARGAAGRPLQGAGAAAPGGESFVAALAALSSVVATIDGGRAGAPAPADDAALPAEEVVAAEEGIVPAPIDPALATMPPAPIAIVATPASRSSAPSDAAAPQTGDHTPGLSAAATASARPPGAEVRTAETADDAQTDTFDAPAHGIETSLPEFDKRRAPASLTAMEHSRMSGLQVEGTAHGDEATTSPNGLTAVVTRGAVPDTQTTAALASTPPVMSAFVQGVSAAPGKGSASDTGDTGGSAFGGHAGSHTPPGVVQGPSLTPGFATLVHPLQTPETVPVETATQIVQAIRMQIMRDGGEAHIRLDPRQFGDMSVRIRVDHGQVTARVEADAPVVREWLQSNQHVLRQNLAGQQLTLDRLEVHEPLAPSDDQRRDRQPARDQERPHQRGTSRRRPETGELFEVVA